MRAHDSNFEWGSPSDMRSICLTQNSNSLSSSFVIASATRQSPCHKFDALIVEIATVVTPSQWQKVAAYILLKIQIHYQVKYSAV